MKKIAFLSYGQWNPRTNAEIRSAADALAQSVELAVAAEELGADGAYFRVHHFVEQVTSPFPLMAAIGQATKRIEIGTAVIDMRYENPLYMAELAATTDLIAGGRLQLGLARGVVLEQTSEGYRHFGYNPAKGMSDADMARDKTERLLEALTGKGFGRPSMRAMFPHPPGRLRIEPHSPGLLDRIWWGSGSTTGVAWAARHGLNFQQAAAGGDDGSGEPLHVQQRKLIDEYQKAWAKAGHQREPRVSVFRNIYPIVNDVDRAYFGGRGSSRDQRWRIDLRTKVVLGRTYAAGPGKLVEQLRNDQAIQAADTLMISVPSELGVDYNVHLIDSVLRHVAPALGWR